MTATHDSVPLDQRSSMLQPGAARAVTNAARDDIERQQRSPVYGCVDWFIYSVAKDEVASLAQTHPTPLG